jgi:hypothetical protein
MWSYIDDGRHFRIADIVYFFEHLRQDGLICGHEVINCIICSRYVAYIQLKLRDG